MKITPFLFEHDKLVRVIEREGEPWFVAKDVALSLGYKNPQEAVREHCKHSQSVGGERNAHPLDPQTKLIPEGDVFRLIIKAHLPGAQEFERLVMDEILPSIRKTGSYGAAPGLDEERG